MADMEFGLVGRTPEGFFRYQAWPTVVRGEDGTLYAASSGHRLGHVCPFGKNLLYITTQYSHVHFFLIYNGKNLLRNTILSLLYVQYIFSISNVSFHFM